MQACRHIDDSDFQLLFDDAKVKKSFTNKKKSLKFEV